MESESMHNAKREGGKTIQRSLNKHTLYSSSEHSQPDYLSAECVYAKTVGWFYHPRV